MTKTPEKEIKHSKIWNEYYAGAILSLIAIFLIVSFGFLKPIIQDIKQANAETKSVLEAKSNEQVYLTSLDNSIGAAQSIPKHILDKVTDALPSEADTPSLLVQLDAAATRHGVRIQSVSFNEPKPTAPAAGQGARPAGPQVLPLDITLSLTAKNYFDIKRFLTDLETSLRLMDVVGISTGGVTAETQEFNFSVQIKTYAFGTPTVKAPTR